LGEKKKIALVIITARDIQAHALLPSLSPKLPSCPNEWCADDDGPMEDSARHQLKPLETKP